MLMTVLLMIAGILALLNVGAGILLRYLKRRDGVEPDPHPFDWDDEWPI